MTRFSGEVPLNPLKGTFSDAEPERGGHHLGSLWLVTPLTSVPVNTNRFNKSLLPPLGATGGSGLWNNQYTDHHSHNKSGRCIRGVSGAPDPGGLIYNGVNSSMNTGTWGNQGIHQINFGKYQSIFGKKPKEKALN